MEDRWGGEFGEWRVFDACAAARRGQAMVEFAVVLPLFLLCLIGALDAGLCGGADLRRGLSGGAGSDDRGVVCRVEPGFRDGA